LRNLCYYLIRKPCYPGENRAMPPRRRHFAYVLDFKSTAHRAVLPAIPRHLVGWWLLL